MEKFKCCADCEMVESCGNACDGLETCDHDPVSEECYDIDGDCYEYTFQIGTRVKHKKHGAGVILPPAPTMGYAILVSFDKVPSVANTRWLYVSPHDLTKLGG